mgnify:CR=1 FL=1
MAILPIVQTGDEILRKKGQEVTEFNAELINLLNDMKETLKDAKGAGLAAPQVNVSKRIFIIDTEDMGIVEFINPVIIQQKGEQTGWEGCLSVRGKSGIVSRPMKVTLAYQDRFGEKHVIKAKGFFAKAICHELDHLDGILYIDKATHIEKN